MDELKKYLQEHAGALDHDEPGPRVWHRIQQETLKPQKANLVRIAGRWAVAACVILSAGIGTWHLLQNDKPVATHRINSIAKTEKKDIPAPATTPNPETPKQLTAANTTRTQKTKIKQQKTTPNHKPQTPDYIVFHNMENSFTQVISLQQARISSTPLFAETPAYFDDFKIQLRQMEKEEKMIKSAIAKRGITGGTLDQLISLYQQKLNILKQLQTEMNKLNSRYKQNRGPVDTTKTYFLNL